MLSNEDAHFHPFDDAFLHPQMTQMTQMRTQNNLCHLRHLRIVNKFNLLCERCMVARASCNRRDGAAGEAPHQCRHNLGAELAQGLRLVAQQIFRAVVLLDHDLGGAETRCKQ